ncbi:MAG: FtsX-like permease family protein [Acidobacteria bacterium]|nr:MAG: FtsX-like permease family protein [Acidobacteriota bacterium]
MLPNPHVEPSGISSLLRVMLFRQLRNRDIEQELFESLTSPRLIASLLAVFALLALVLSLLGVYGVVSYLVSHSLREVGIRMALGATRARVLRMVLEYGLRRVVAGVVIGAGLSAAVTRVLSSQLFAIAPTDPVTFSGVSNRSDADTEGRVASFMALG